MERSNQLIERARRAKTKEELISLAKEEGMELTEEQAEEYFSQLHASGELADEELDNVAGGGCHKKDGRLVVTVGHSCGNYQCKYCEIAYADHYCLGKSEGVATWVKGKCSTCRYCSYENALWLCNHINNYLS